MHPNVTTEIGLAGVLATILAEFSVLIQSQYYWRSLAQ